MPTTEELTYDERREHIRLLVQDYLYWITLKELCNAIGRGKQSKYQYAWQSLKGYPNKKSNVLLDELEDELKDRNLWVEYGEIDFDD